MHDGLRRQLRCDDHVAVFDRRCAGECVDAAQRQRARTALDDRTLARKRACIAIIVGPVEDHDAAWTNIQVAKNAARRSRADELNALIAVRVRCERGHRAANDQSSAVQDVEILRRIAGHHDFAASAQYGQALEIVAQAPVIAAALKIDDAARRAVQANVLKACPVHVRRLRDAAWNRQRAIDGEIEPIGRGHVHDALSGRARLRGRRVAQACTGGNCDGVFKGEAVKRPVTAVDVESREAVPPDKARRACAPDNSTARTGEVEDVVLSDRCSGARRDGDLANDGRCRGDVERVVARSRQDRERADRSRQLACRRDRARVGNRDGGWGTEK